MHAPIRVLFVGDAGPQDSVTAPIEAANDRLSVVAVNTAAAASAVLADGDVDCVVSEYDLPETDGVEFLRRVRADDARLPFVLWTGSGSERVASDAIAAGVTDYLPRGADGGSPAELAARVADAVDRVRATPAPGDASADADDDAPDDSTCDERCAEERARRERAIRDAYDVVTDPDRSFREQVDGLLELGREVVDTEYAAFSHVNEDRCEYTFERLVAPEDAALQSGNTVSLDVTPNCARVVETGQSLVLQNVEAEAPELRDPEWGVSSYLGAPVTVDDEVYGTFCFFDTEPRPEPFTDWEETYVDLLGNWVEYELRRRRTTDRLEALDSLNRIARDINRALADQSSRAEIERVVCRRLTDSESYEFAWTAARDDDTGDVALSTVPDDRGSLDVTFGTDSGESDDAPAATALRTGELQVVRDVRGVLDDEGESDGGGGALATIPITYEDRCYGLLNVYTGRKNAFEGEERAVVRQFGDIVGIAIAAVEHERELAHERERLEFVNRLLRHDLLNSLNVVEARAEILEGNVEPHAAPHLETLRNRTDDMIDHIETLRSLTNTLVASDDPDLEPVDLGRVLRDAIARAEQMSDRAVFEVNGDLGWTGTVMADDLLGAVFENLFSNAVKHNDKRFPQVELDVERGEAQTVVRVADNGPGVPEEVRKSVFQKGQKGCESPGTGFGLYFVREIVEWYGGTVTVGDNDPEGTVFTVTLPSGRDAVRTEAGRLGPNGASYGSE